MNLLFLLLFLNFLLIYKSKKSFLMILISMEFVVMTILFLVFFLKLMFNEWLFIYYMIFAVCESVVGFSIMINLIYKFGNENISVLNLMW